MPPYLDHIVILIPYASLLTLPSWIPKNFALTPGGTHSGGQTANRLVCFQDGSYLEFISFVNDDPKNREGHCWGDCKSGIIDFAFTSGDADKNWEGVDKGLKEGNSGVRYEKPRDGGRKRPDGKEIKWKVTWPVAGGELGLRRGEAPFFCHDVTERELRVPTANTTHPTLAYGINKISIYVPPERATLLAEAYEAILDTRNLMDGNARPGGIFEIPRMEPVEGVEDSLKIYVHPPPDEEQKLRMEERVAVMVGDLVVGGLSTMRGNDVLIRIDIPPPEEGVGGVFLNLDMP